jgi:asparagine synthase (glutamine-hydrolysing)
VPVGAFLSGGIDSSLVSALAAPRTRETLRTFTVGFHEEEKDERPYARKVVEHFGTDHHEGVLDQARAMQMIPEVIEAFDEPYSLGSAFPTLEVSRLARDSSTKVILGGDGGDEGFAGCLRYDDFAARFPDDRLSRARRRLERLVPVLRRPRKDPVQRFFRYEGVLDAEQQAPLLTRDVRGAVDIDPLWRLRRFYDPSLPSVTAAQLLDVHTFLCDEILAKVDRASMSHGVEVRVPLLDTELLELCFRISERVVYGGGERKHLLKKAGARWIPPDVLTARKKGFSIPTREWFGPTVRPRVRAILRDGVLVSRGIFDPDGIDSLVDEPKVSWHLLVIELWARRWLEGQALDYEPLPMA